MYASQKTQHANLIEANAVDGEKISLGTKPAISTSAYLVDSLHICNGQQQSSDHQLPLLQ
jgi:hypothetical protein